MENESCREHSRGSTKETDVQAKKGHKLFKSFDYLPSQPSHILILSILLRQNTVGPC